MPALKCGVSRETAIKRVTPCTATLMLLLEVSAVCSNFLPWWSGASSSIVLGIARSRKSTIGLWHFDVIALWPDPRVPWWLRERNASWVEKRVTDSWDNYCTDGNIRKFATGRDTKPQACITIKACRAFSMLASFSLFITSIVTFVSICKNKLLILVGAGGSAFTLFFAGLGCGIAFLTGAESLGGVGYMCLEAVALGGLVCIGLCYYAAAYALPPDALPKPPPPAPRQQRHREAKRKDYMEALAMTEFIAKSKLANKGGASPTSQLDVSVNPAQEDVTILPADAAETQPPEEVKVRSYKHLKQVLFWQAEHGHEEDEDIPIDMLQQAFQEIDVDFSGNIDTAELLDAFRNCGLPASESATESIVREIDMNNSGDIDIQEFVDFFRQLQELQRQQKKNEDRSLFIVGLCRLCFVMHIALFCVFCILMARGLWGFGGGGTERGMAFTMFFIVCGLLALLCCVNVILPAFKLTFGYQFSIWCKYFDIWLQARRAEKLRKRREQAQKELERRTREMNSGLRRKESFSHLKKIALTRGPSLRHSFSSRSNSLKQSFSRASSFFGRSSTAAETGGAKKLPAGAAIWTPQALQDNGDEGDSAASPDLEAHIPAKLDAEGGIERYDPSSYALGLRVAVEKAPDRRLRETADPRQAMASSGRSFNALQTHSLAVPQAALQQEAQRTRQLVLGWSGIPGALTEGGYFPPAFVNTRDWWDEDASTAGSQVEQLEAQLPDFLQTANQNAAANRRGKRVQLALTAGKDDSQPSEASFAGDGE